MISTDICLLKFELLIAFKNCAYRFLIFQIPNHI